MQRTDYIDRLKKKWPVLLAVIGAIGAGVIILVVVSWQLIKPYGKYILTTEDQIGSKNVKVGLVLGAGVNGKGKPYKELQARLDVAAAALDRGDVTKLILSGDNRHESYNEPIAMRKYLMYTKSVPESKLVMDFAGRSTYESCERATRIFGQNKLIIFSANSHLPRAIYLCRHFGIEAYGVSSGVEANNSWRREILARVKAVINVYIRGEKTILGDPIKI